MKILLSLITLITLASCASHSNHKHHRGIASSSEKPQIDQVFAAATGNFNGDSYSDIAFIIDNPNNEEYFELWIYLTTSEGHGSRQLALKNTQFIYKVKGQFVSVGEPSLSIETFESGKPDSLVVSAEHFGIGRSASSYEVKFAFRDGEFLTAGIEYTSYDKLQEYGSQRCSFNLLTGRYNDGIRKKNRSVAPDFTRRAAVTIDGNFFEDVVGMCPYNKN